MADEGICPKCRFPKRISGHIFTKKNESLHLVKDSRCPLCRHVPDYIVLSIDPKVARIIYRNFNDSVEYFQKVKDYLIENGFEVKN